MGEGRKGLPVFDWIYGYPTAPMAAAFALGFSGVTVALLIGLRPFVNRWAAREPRTNELVGFIMGAFSMLYGLLLGLLAVAAYQNIDDIDNLVTKEAASIGALYSDVGQLPEPYKTALQQSVRNYMRFVIDVDWPAMQQGEEARGSDEQMRQLFFSLTAFKPGDLGEAALFEEALARANVVVDLRRQRMTLAGDSIPNILWAVVLLGAFITLLLVCLLDMDSGVHIALAVLLSGYLGIVIYFVAAMDQPFKGEFSVSAGPFEQVYAAVMEE